MKKVTAYEVFGVFGNYDGDAPSTSNLCLVATEQIAKDVCAILNDNPTQFDLFYEGWDKCKRKGGLWKLRFEYRRELTTNPSQACATLDETLDEINGHDGEEKAGD